MTEKYVIMRMIPLFSVEGEAKTRERKVKKKFFLSFLNFSSWRSSRCSQNLFPDATGKNSNTWAHVEWVLFHYTTYELVDMYPSCLLCLLEASFFLSCQQNHLLNIFDRKQRSLLHFMIITFHLNKFMTLSSSNCWLWLRERLLTFERKFEL